MLSSAYDERITMRAWELLLEGRIEPARSSLPVRLTINDSWHRCASGGLDAQRNEAPIETDKDAVEALTRSSSELLAAAARPFDAIGKLSNGTGAMLMLADGEGVLIDVIGDKKTIYDSMDIHLGVGGRATNIKLLSKNNNILSYVGTNVGTSQIRNIAPGFEILRHDRLVAPIQTSRIAFAEPAPVGAKSTCPTKMRPWEAYIF